MFRVRRGVQHGDSGPMKSGGSLERSHAIGTPSTEWAGPMTMALPAISIPAVTVHAASPALITRPNAGHLGMTGNELVRVLREMRGDPRFRDASDRALQELRHGGARGDPRVFCARHLR